MADFLTDYSNLAAAGAGFNSFAQAYKDAQDQQLKKQEAQSRMEAQKAQIKRDAENTALQAWRDRAVKNAATGEYEEAPLTQRDTIKQSAELYPKGLQVGDDGQVGERPLSKREQIAEELKARGEGFKVGDDGKLVADPTSPKQIAAKNSMNKTQVGNDFKQESLDLRKDVVDRREHERVLSRINSNPNVKQRLTQYQNLDNALNNLANSDHLTLEQFNEAQQAVRANLGIKGQSGVGEREGTYLKSLGLNAQHFEQFLTGVPSDISKQNEFLKHIQNLANLEKKNISSQFDKSLGASSSGHASMYARRPDLKEDLKDALTSQREQLEQRQQPQGLINPGLVGQGGLVGGAPQPQSFSPDVVKYASEHGITPEQAQAIKIKRTGGQ